MTFNSLSNDVLGLILLEVHKISRQTLFSTLRTNKALHDSTKPLIYRDCVLDLSDSKLDETNGRITSWIETEREVLRYIRWLTVVQPHHYYRSTSTNGDELRYSSLITLLSQLRGLVQFTFALREPMPVGLLDCLDSFHPAVELHIRNWTRKSISTPFGDPAELALANSPLLRTIQASVLSGNGEIDLQRAAFMRIVTVAPNLESYNWSSHSGGGCVIRMMSSQQYEEQARLEKEFDVDRPVKKVLKAIHINHEVSSVENQAGIVDLGKLERLGGVHISRNVDERLKGVFSSLRALDLKVRTWRTDSELDPKSFQGFLCSLPSLEELSISGGLKYIDLKPLLSYHGPTLRTLHLHESETTNLENPRRTLSLDDLCLIRDSCPHLYDLGIDVSYIRTDPKESEIYAVLSTFGNIYSLTLNYDLGIGLYSTRSRRGKDDQYDTIRHQINALIDKQNTTTKLEAIWAEVVGPKLQEILVQVGKQDREMGKGYPASWVRYERSMRTWYKLEYGVVMVSSRPKDSF
ncbi:hypothetical protein K435DRAFT_835430 [Dendrothele bispora CBS 962.96]|uniref:F-box domain-containing protein n=1 Tax=Dendrothele bispora (strain CBS 962.96) TaxID=1314807 RepID=A0A4S8MN24_DENBC|nr:hypothetical protein K435DRAFT_835430 [Dendrothele bispora CBS 962.96]